ncbi:dienoyl-CoA reductase-like NADH-dependent reductase (Old Yellow Enzyme family) 2-4 [Sporomusaceae bacterium BoRhaA]|uniref:NADH:flavin oxidoreductase n=1 Tax=Pelorhabdus rhamnosifermentans TaxID=2772457 RepID=UPI001C064206|nr:NADH:flavin oxidoreductase [Pelorhabdus rhamnosifermentans]MBU2700074.1 dienoyl-CoA reductase-like NADH-dependent reductase (Old Yellow Enzyme family) 2-4 [Pelorhabdus rhamnosifermentans]
MKSNEKLTNNDLEVLYQPVSIGNLTLANRIVMAPMTRGFSPNGIPGADVAGYYRRRAENEVGLIITEGTLINHPAAAEGLGRPNFHGEAALNGWSRVVESVHKAGGKIIPQLWHVGMARQINGENPNPAILPIGPSGIDVATGEKVTEAMTLAEIDQIIKAFGQAASDAKRLGFDGIELHGAHGYLIDQFFWEKTNQRQDKYGGDLIARTRFASEIIKACRQVVGPDFPIVFRYSQWKMGNYTTKLAKTPDQLSAFLKPLVAAGVDIFHCSTRRYWEPEFEGALLNLAGWTKKLTGKPTITVGSVGLDNNFIDFFTEGKGAKTASLIPLIERLQNKEFDLVAVGRALLADPAWATKIHQNRADELIPFELGAEKTLS